MTNTTLILPVDENSISVLADYDVWFHKPAWTLMDTAAIISGLNPEIAFDPKRKETFDKTLDDPVSHKLWRYTEENHRDWHEISHEYFESFRCDYAASLLNGIIYNPQKEELFYDSVMFRPMDIIQWCVDHGIPMHYSLTEYLQRMGFEFRFSENSAILNDYKLYGRHDVWHIPVAARLILGIHPHISTNGLSKRRNLYRHVDPNYSQTAADEVYYIMELAMEAWKTKNLDFFNFYRDDPEYDYHSEDNCSVQVEAKKFVEWAIKKGFNPPAQLLEIMGLKDRLDVNPAIKSAYLPPYMAIMFEAVEALQITKDSQPSKQRILDWLDTKHTTLSGREKEAIATFIREPAMKKGGYYTGRP